MSLLSNILEYNKTFVDNKQYEEFLTDKFPDKRMVILTCMDTRLVELLPRALNLRNGDAKIIKNAGALVSHPFGSVMRSIIVAVYELNADEVLVIGHKECGMTGLNANSVLNKARERGISQVVLNTLEHSGIRLEKWLRGFNEVNEAVAKSLSVIRNHPLLPPSLPVHGLVIDPATGELELVEEGYKNAVAGSTEPA
ncbi:putative carbonic anhydrase YtiB [Paenibacillus larvae subsp. larvae]|uniref:carbonic anhydrase n=2 Tax=Paenibacillus larvae TaxID=1464 RepID=A0A2L1TZ87_9BACL|nr:carbonic anhydrase [Paenibacillus larvae]AQT86397.1 carbonic anhydrase [Paenibacillus larvae subsp. pulvifaciens]AQZ48054.1 carbonic anhydrase [Paenibacillus larvae subsp. pulvifaciens]ARF66858.1 carbonic anhydrase [Paenibacillus larvae subsp. pulvifaciens]AVF25985.1 putative carbonic anhydrase YtiB [Paenibacillus larvae subsp. larvae]AVF30762.1 putative carbonic anhydrase YtiB [Paenibacillus larvae subsp. larvae]